eukprot:CAMPEP_0172471112 /NCGR_PEP_ID=MMETSP1065-20121228/67649_1 /TAXON_ID=265537 /ORGANISM="Amphiprora paludosa, Strain CCMP125" /LENGTH=43 /DNA_ID= /DNA_START= /DNA_END= /DNA_ORIENTATION=
MIRIQREVEFLPWSECGCWFGLQMTNGNGKRSHQGGENRKHKT